MFVYKILYKFSYHANTFKQVYGYKEYYKKY